MTAPGEWNVYDIIYTAPRFNNNGALFSPARVTVLHNGILIQNDVHIQGNTEFIFLSIRLMGKARSFYKTMVTQVSQLALEIYG
jgi:hypothetical protein